MTRAKHTSLFFLALLVFGALFLGTRPEQAYSQGTAGIMSGYAWSDMIGWVSFTGATYGMSVDAAGVLSGYAWSDSIGWISANAADLTGCPQVPCTARIENGLLKGWLKALSGGGIDAGGWDGFIALEDTNTGDGISYGVSLAGGAFSGFAWGEAVVGWLDFSEADTTYLACAATQGYFCSNGNTISNHRDAQCVVTQEVCSTLGTGWYCTGSGVCTAPPLPGGSLTLSPRIITSGQTTTITWDVDDTNTCQVEGTNGQLITGGASGSGASVAITQATAYTLSCLGGDGSYHDIDEETIAITPGWVER